MAQGMKLMGCVCSRGLWIGLAACGLALACSCSSGTQGPVEHGGEGGGSPAQGENGDEDIGGVARVQPTYEPPVTVSVLGLRSATSEEDVSREMTAALRREAEAGGSSGLVHSGNEEDLGSLMMVFGCEEPTGSCLQQFGENLESDYLVFGLLEPESGRSDSGYQVSLSFYNVRENEVERTLMEVFPRDVSTGDMTELARRFYGTLTGVVIPGELYISCNVAGAQVTLNGEDVGTTSERPLVVRDLAPDELRLIVGHEGYERDEREVTIEPGRIVEVEVELEPR